MLGLGSWICLALGSAGPRDCRHTDTARLEIHCKVRDMVRDPAGGRHGVDVCRLGTGCLRAHIRRASRNAQAAQRPYERADTATQRAERRAGESAIHAEHARRRPTPVTTRERAIHDRTYAAASRTASTHRRRRPSLVSCGSRDPAGAATARPHKCEVARSSANKRVLVGSGDGAPGGGAERRAPPARHEGGGQYCALCVDRLYTVTTLGCGFQFPPDMDIDRCEPYCVVTATTVADMGDRCRPSL